MVKPQLRWTPAMGAVVAALTVVVGAAGGAQAAPLEKGSRCKLRAALPVLLTGPSGRVEASLDPGTEVDITGVGTTGRAKIVFGDGTAQVVTTELEAACAGTLRQCRLSDDLTMYEETSSDSRAFRVKSGAPVVVLKSGKTWAAVHVGDLAGFINADELRRACPVERAGGDDGDAATEPTIDKDPDLSDDGSPIDEIDRPEGPGVLLLPFALSDEAPAGSADMILAGLHDKLLKYRPDGVRAPYTGDRRISWKEWLERGARQGKRTGCAYVILGRLALEKEQPVLELSLVEVRSLRRLKNIRARPTTDPKDPWAESALAALMPMIPAAPGSKNPASSRFESPKNGIGTTR